MACRLFGGVDYLTGNLYNRFGKCLHQTICIERVAIYHHYARFAIYIFYMYADMEFQSVDVELYELHLFSVYCRIVDDTELVFISYVRCIIVVLAYLGIRVTFV